MKTILVIDSMSTWETIQPSTLSIPRPHGKPTPPKSINMQDSTNNPIFTYHYAMVTSGDESSTPPAPAPHVAIFPFPFASHVSSSFSLVERLAAATPSAIFSFVSTAETLESLPKTAANIRLLTYEDEITTGSGFLVEMERFFDSAVGRMRDAVKAAEGEAGGILVTCIVSDAFIWMADLVAEEMGLPWIPIFAAFPLALIAHVFTDDLRSRFQNQDEDAYKLIDFIPALATIQVRDIPDGIIFNYNSKFALNIHNMARRLPRAAAIILPTSAGLELDSTFQTTLKQTLLIGPLDLLSPPPYSPDKENCLTWLESHEPSSVVYIAFGTLVPLPPADLAELAHGLEDSGVPFLWSLKEDIRSRLPEGFVERTRSRGKLVNWAPQRSVLSHPAVGVFMTHGGWNSVIESIMAETVMICRSIYAEQGMTSRALESIMGIGLYLDSGIKREVFVGALNVVLKGDDGKRMKKRVVEIKEMTEKACLPGGSFSENFNKLVELVCKV